MMPTEIRSLLDYHYWARDRSLAACAALTPTQFLQPIGGSFGSVRDTLAHTLGAEMIWLQRWRGEAPAGLPPAAQFPDLPAIGQAWREQQVRLRAFVDPLDQTGLERVIDYRSFAGQPSRSVLWQMIQHVVNHATYHRGQVTTLLRQLGVAGGQSQDLIAFYRERATA